MSSPPKEELRLTAIWFCRAFVEGDPPSQILSKFFNPINPRITEHGPLTSSLPFLGKTFSGRDSTTSTSTSSNSDQTQSQSQSQTCDAYFNLLSQTLKFEPSENTFPSPESFLIDEECEINGKKGVVSVTGNGRFRSLKTGKVWDEVFIYRLSEFDEEGRIGHWEIWADTLSAWEAVNS